VDDLVGSGSGRRVLDEERLAEDALVRGGRGDHAEREHGRHREHSTGWVHDSFLLASGCSSPTSDALPSIIRAHLDDRPGGHAPASGAPHEGATQAIHDRVLLDHEA